MGRHQGVILNGRLIHRLWRDFQDRLFGTVRRNFKDFTFVVVRRDLSRARHVILVVVQDCASLPSGLLLNNHGLQKDRPSVARTFRFLVCRTNTMIRVYEITARMSTRDSHVNVKDRIKFCIVSRPAAFARESIRTTIRTQTARSVIRRMGYNTLIVMYVVSPTTGRSVYLIDVLVRCGVLKRVGKEQDAAVVRQYYQCVHRGFFYRGRGFLRARVTRGGRGRVIKVMRTNDRYNDVLATGLLWLLKVTGGITSRKVPPRCRILGVVRS